MQRNMRASQAERKTHEKVSLRLREMQMSGDTDQWIEDNVNNINEIKEILKILVKGVMGV